MKKVIVIGSSINRWPNQSGIQMATFQTSNGQLVHSTSRAVDRALGNFGIGPLALLVSNFEVEVAEAGEPVMARGVQVKDKDGNPTYYRKDGQFLRITRLAPDMNNAATVGILSIAANQNVKLEVGGQSFNQPTRRPDAQIEDQNQDEDEDPILDEIEAEEEFEAEAEEAEAEAEEAKAKSVRVKQS